MKELDWIAEARRNIGLKEIKGVKHHPTITKWLKNLGSSWHDDETPWCGTFVAHCLQSAGVKYPKHWYRALAYADKSLATQLSRPAYGCVAVKKRVGGGHVCFVVGRAKNGGLLCLGGNQSDGVNIAVYPESVFTFWWYGKGKMPLPERYNLTAGDGVRAGSEA